MKTSVLGPAHPVGQLSIEPRIAAVSCRAGLAPSAAAFVQDTASLFHDRLGLRAGLRLGSYTYEAPADPTLGVSDERVRMSAATFNVGAVWSLTDAVNLTGSVSRGFRAANAFDLGAIGVSGGGFEVAPTEARCSSSGQAPWLPS